MPPRVILVDNTVLAYLFLGQPQFEAAARNLRRKCQKWFAPPLCWYEFGNVLRTYVRSGNKTATEAQSLLQAALQLVNICEEPDESEILAHAISSNLTFYDATYVACARTAGLTLYTRDEEILRNCPDVAQAVSSVP